jgi:sterol desaturase/sphingolipid hydroxylase (fatty acid hydroxylase superfamily)
LSWGKIFTLFSKEETMIDRTQINTHAKHIGFFLVISCAMIVYMASDGARMYWPYMLSSYYIAIFAYILEIKDIPVGARPSLFAYLFPRTTWTHPSMLNDALLALVNFVIIMTCFNLAFMNPDNLMELAHSLTRWLPPVQGAAAGGKTDLGPVIIFTLTSSLLPEFFYYWSHRLSHKIPALWEFHKVHHSAKIMTPLTLYRMHPLDYWLTAAARGLGTGLADVIFLHFYPSVSIYTILGSNIVVFFANSFGGNLRHTHIWLSFGPKVEHFFLSPAQHQIHHSENPLHFNKNYGALFSIYDWVFGSLYVTTLKRENITFGLGDDQEEQLFKNIFTMLTHPLLKIFRQDKNAINNPYGDASK